MNLEDMYLYRAAQPQRPVGLTSVPCVPGQRATVEVKLDRDGLPVLLTDLDVTRMSCAEWLILAIKVDQREALVDSIDPIGIPADMFAPDAYAPPLDLGCGVVLTLKVERIVIPLPAWWRRALGATRLDKLAPLARRLGPGRIVFDTEMVEDYEPLYSEVVRNAWSRWIWRQASRLERIVRNAWSRWVWRQAARLERTAEWRFRQSPEPQKFYATAWCLPALGDCR